MTVMTQNSRIQQCIKTVADRIKVLPADKVASLEKTARADDFTEIIGYQNAQARAHAMGILDLDTALWLYGLFGGECPTCEHFNKAPLAERIVAMETIVASIKRMR